MLIVAEQRVRLHLHKGVADQPVMVSQSLFSGTTHAHSVCATPPAAEPLRRASSIPCARGTRRSSSPNLLYQNRGTRCLEPIDRNTVYNSVANLWKQSPSAYGGGSKHQVIQRSHRRAFLCALASPWPPRRQQCYGTISSRCLLCSTLSAVRMSLRVGVAQMACQGFTARS